MSKPRKKYRPKSVYLNPIQVAIANTKPLDDHGQSLINVKHPTAMSAIVRGEGGRDEWEILAGMVNMIRVISECFFQKSYVLEIIKASEALKAMRERYTKFNRFGFTGDELKVMNKVIVIADEMFKKVTRKELSSIIKGLENGRFAA